MNFHQESSYKERKKGKRIFKKSVVHIMAVVSLISGGVSNLSWNGTFESANTIVRASELKHGQEIGQLNGKPVIRSTVNDMKHPAFQELVDSILADKDISNIKYVANAIQWNANSEVKGVNGTSPVDVSSFGVNVFHYLRGDGFVGTDKGAILNRGQSLAVTNVGTVTELETGENIPVHLVVTYRHSVHGADGQATTNAYTAIKNQSGVITIAGATTTSGVVYDPGGGTGEGPGGGSPGGGTGTGYIGYIDEYAYSADIVRADNGEVIPDGQLLMAIKVSDIDAHQRAQLGAQGVLAYIVSPSSKLSIGDGGLIATSDEAFNADTTDLSDTSYIALKAWSANAVNFKYTDGKRNHTTIVTGLFGNTGFKLNPDQDGVVKIVKTGTQSGTTMWNRLYTLKGNTFKLTNKKTGQTVEGTTNEKGELVFEKVPFGDYTVEEVTASLGFNKTFKTQDITLSAQTPKVTIKGKEDQLVTVSGTNDEIVGKIKIVKKGTESQLAMWNALYSLEGNTFKLTNSLSGKVYDIRTDAKGEAEVPGGVELGDYTIEEVSSSAGFAKTFETQKVTLRQDGKLEVEVTGTNDEIKGQNTLEKVDNVTGTTAHGQARLEDAEYTLYYNDDSTGSSPHKKDTPVKWSDLPNATLIIGDKVKTSIVGGVEVDNGDNIVLNLDDKELKVAVGNLALGKYYWKETNAPEGYALDGKKHEFEITKKDDVTKNIVTTNTRSLEQIITAVISLQKIAQSDGNVSSAGLNDVTFSVTPINNTKAEAFEVTTGIKNDEDGYAAFELVYGDWKIEEKEAPEGYALIKPVYIHMSYDDKTDLYTITASHYEDGKKPFSKRVFSQSDDAAEKNPNAKGSLAGTVSSSNFKISLSKQTYKDNETPTPPTPEPPTPPAFQPEKFNLDKSDVDKTVDKLLDDDDELKDEYMDTNKDPYADKSDNNDAANHNTKLVKRGQKFYYQVWMDTNQFTAEHLISALGLIDDYDEVNLTLHLDNIKGWDGKTGEDVLKHFDLSAKDGQLTIQTKDSLLKDKIIDTSKLPFGRYYKFEIPVTVKETAQDGVDIINTAKQFIVQYNPETKENNPPTEKITQKRVNPLKLPVPQPHKFSVTGTGYDIDGTKLLDDDNELKDRYADTKADPYSDKTNNNEDQNFNTKTVKPGESFVYQVWVDTTPWNKHDLLQTVGAEDSFDAQNLTIDVAKIKAYIKGKDKKDVTDQFDISIKDGTLSILPKDSMKKDIDLGNGKKARVLDTSKFELGVTYQFDIPVTVKEDVKAGTDIKNTARQIIIDKDGEVTKIDTETRVNPTPRSIFQGTLPNTGEMVVGGTGLGFVLLFVTTVLWTNRFRKVNTKTPVNRITGK